MEELTALGVLIPLEPWILAVVETCQCILDNLKRLGLLANANYHSRLNRERRNVNYLAINNDVLVAYQLACSCTSGGDTQAEYDVVKTALQILKENLTGNAFSLCRLLKHITELTLKNTIGVLSFLLLCQHDTVLRHLSATAVAMLSRREVSSGQNFVCAEDGLTKSTCNFRFRTYISSHNI